MNFSDLHLSDEVLRAVTDAGYVEPTPIQAQAIPHVLMGRDVLGCAQTGTGKTASFTLPMIDILAEGRARARMPRSLIIEPTRELAAQVEENFAIYGKYHRLSTALLIGGESMSEQERLLMRGVDVLIATPGRLLDLFERGQLLLNDVKLLVIDEADRMLDMGFIPDVEKIVSLVNRNRQTLFFSATMPPEIRRLADKFLTNPKEVTVSRPATTAETVSQFMVKTDARRKRDVLRDVIRQENVTSGLVFCNRKRDVATVGESLRRDGFKAGYLHGDLAQSVRTETLDKFKSGEIVILVASDVAARGLDIDDVSHVFNFDVPYHADDYVHRIGRTGRAGKSGRAITLVTDDDAKNWAAIARLIKQDVPALNADTGAPAHPAPSASTAGDAAGDAPDADAAPAKRRGRRRSAHSKPGAKPGAKPELASGAHAGNDGSPRRDAPEPAARTRPSPERSARTERPERPQRQGGGGRRAREDAEDAVPQGLGDHVPAFLLRPVRRA